MKRLTSRHHPLVAACRQLARGRPAEHDRILLDGAHLVQEACRAGLVISAAAAETGWLADPAAAGLVDALERGGAEVVEVTGAVLEAMSPVASPAGIVAIARRPAARLESVFARPPQLVLLGVDIQDPGNVGAMARAAEAGGATGFAVCGASADPFGWKALRGSMGSLLRLPVASGVSWRDAVGAARLAGAAIVATHPHGGTPLFDMNLRGPVAFLLGGEGPGLPIDAMAAADCRVSIPMQAPVESLNVAVAAALLVYEAARQRPGRQGSESGRGARSSEMPNREPRAGSER
jgi:TrmH family RNA methyltransferase